MGLHLKDLDSNTRIHFIGIGGISMSALAEILHGRGFKVTGSDFKSSDITEGLRNKGIDIEIGHKSENVEGADLVIYTAAIAADNPERIRCAELGIPSYERPVLLGAIMKSFKFPVAVSGTHGKTTTTSMLSHVFIAEGVDPTILVGGNLNSIGGNLHLGNSRKYFITEACEYHESFLEFHPFASIILNIEADHLDYFRNLEHITDSFGKFAKMLPNNGLLVVNGDNESAMLAAQRASSRVVTYGLSDKREYYAEDIAMDERNFPNFNLMHSGKKVCKIQLSVPGIHNVSNAVGTAALALEMGISSNAVKEGLIEFCGTDRRYQLKGEVNGITLIDDYAHHPTEIKATLAAAKPRTNGRIFCAFQPHTYTRTKLLFEEFKTAFADADVVLLADIYAAREKDTGLINSKVLADGINEVTHNAQYLGSFENIAEYIRKNAVSGDTVISMGAGDIYTVLNILKGL